VSVVAPRGASALFPASYFAAPNQEATVFSWRSHGSDPVVRTLALTLSAGVVPINEFFRNFTLAWRIRAGVQAISVDYLIDALGTQQVSLPCDAIDVSLLTRVPNDASAYQVPRIALRATACIADGAVSGRSATLTSQFIAAAGSSTTLLIPQGVRAWRLAGFEPPSGFAGPFSPLVTYRTFGNYSSVAITGFELAQLTASDGFVPLTGTALGGLVISNDSAIEVGGFIIWELDL